MPSLPISVGFASDVRALCQALITTHFDLGIVGRAFRDIWLPEIMAATAAPANYPDLDLLNYRGFNHNAQEFLGIGQSTWPLFNLLDQATPDVIAFVENTDGMDATTVAVDLVKQSISWQDRADVRYRNPLNQKVTEVIGNIVNNANRCRRIQLEWRATTKAQVEALADGETHDGVTKEQWLATINSITSYANYCFGYTAKLDAGDVQTKGYGHGDIIAAF